MTLYYRLLAQVLCDAGLSGYLLQAITATLAFFTIILVPTLTKLSKRKPQFVFSRHVQKREKESALLRWICRSLDLRHSLLIYGYFAKWMNATISLVLSFAIVAFARGCPFFAANWGKL